MVDTTMVERLRDHSRAHQTYANATDRAEAADTIEKLAGALEPFAKCVEQIGDEESDEEWAKFRLLIKDYRRASAALALVRKETDHG